MKSRRNSARGRVVAVAAIMALALLSVVCAGCGESASAAETTLAVPSQVVTTLFPTTTSSTQTTGSLSLHERVMAEQGRGPGAAPAVVRTTTTSTALPVPAAAPLSAEAAVPQATNVVLTDGQTPLTGVWNGTADQLASFLTRACPSPRFSVPTPLLAEYYVLYSGEAGLRADLLWAQMIHETGYGTYGGDVVPEQNNYAGIGATGSHEPGVAFPTAEAGVMAHVAHMVAYVYPSSPVRWADATTDPRFDFVDPRGVASILADLNGRWAVPGATYGQSIEAVAWAINFAVAPDALVAR